MQPAKITFAILFLFSLFLPSRSVYADVAPPPAPQLGGLEPFDYQDTNVQMVYERVEMEIQPIFVEDGDYSFFASRVNVTAYFTMHNRGHVSESMQVVFPLESFSDCRMGFGGGNSYTDYFVQKDSFSAIVDGHQVSIQEIVTDHPIRMEEVCEEMVWAGFDVTFPVDEDVLIKVQYVMETMGRADAMQNIEYVLQTGAGWSGPIQRGYVIVKFPYTATAENILVESTPGYQFLYNEVFWSFENLEPTSENDLQISIVSPDTWQKIISIRRDLKQNPQLPEKWLELAQIYFDIATWHWDNVRSRDYLDKVSSAYEGGIAANPDNAELYARYAEFRMYLWSPRLIRELNETEAKTILSLLNRALALDPDNGTANTVRSYLEGVAPFITYTAPPTVPPTATSLFTATPTLTPTATITPAPSAGPLVITVVHTKLVKLPTSTSRPRPTAKSSPTDTPVQEENDPQSGSLPIILSALVVFAAGVGLGALGSKWVRK